MNVVNIHIDPDTLAAYALDALELNEVIEIGRHLQVCPQCQREVTSLRASASLLPYGLPAGEPPADLRDRVLRAARSGGPIPARESQYAAFGRRRSWSTWFRRLAPALAALIFVSGMLVGRSWSTGAERDIRGLPEAQVVNLAGEGRGTFVVVPTGGEVLLTVTGLPPLDPNRVYQLWFLGTDAPISAGTFVPDANGQGRLEFKGLAWSPEYNGVAITVEPLGGSPGPTSDIVSKGDL